MATINQVVDELLGLYYQQFDSDRKGIASLYRDESVMTFLSASACGVNAIVEKLVGLPAQKVRHEVRTCDAQPGFAEGGVLVLVTGDMLFDDDERRTSFAQTFHLNRDPSGRFFVSHDILQFVT